jgi:site-specific DNA recombinase
MGSSEGNGRQPGRADGRCHFGGDIVKRTVIYTRVSTKRQKERGYSLSFQAKRCREYAQREGLQIVAVIQDDITGATELSQREGGKKLLEMVGNGGNINHVIVWRLDRLSRPPKGRESMMLTTIEAFRDRGVQLHDCKAGEIGADMMSILSAFFQGLSATEERERITERSIEGRLAKARSGKWVGQGFPPFGFKKIGRGQEAKVAIDPEDAEIVRMIFDLYIGRDGEALSLYGLAKLLTAKGIKTPGHWRRDRSESWSYSHIGRRIIQNRAYLGEFQYRGIKMHFPELAIVDDETFQLAQKRVTSNKRRSTKPTNEVYLLSSRMKCTCGALLSGFCCRVNTKKGVNVHRYYRCKKRNHYADEGQCRQQNIRVDKIDPKAWEWVVNIISDDARLEELIGEMVAEATAKAEPAKLSLETNKGILARTEKQLRAYMQDFGDAKSQAVKDALKAQISSLGALIDSLKVESKQLEATIARAEITPTMQQEIRNLAAEARKRLQEGGTERDRKMIIEALDVQAELFYSGQQQQLRITYGLKNFVDIICLDEPSSA